MGYVAPIAAAVVLGIAVDAAPAFGVPLAALVVVGLVYASLTTLQKGAPQ